MDSNAADEYFEKLRNGTATKQDNTLFTEWLARASDSEINAVLDQYGHFFESQNDEPAQDDHLIALIEQKLDKADGDAASKTKTRQIGYNPLKIAISIAAVLAVFFVLRPLFNAKTGNQPIAAVYPKKSKIIPGGNKATLTLGNGKTILLDAAANGVLASQNNVRILKSKSGQLIYDATSYLATSNAELSYNKIDVPRGGQYQVVLPDGSKVWLNAQSSLRYPAHFNGDKRLVELTGEAYFEVAKDSAHPFQISINGMQVQVLGTHFNIMGYQDEGCTKTTLLEGSVKIIKGGMQQMIIPGQQAIVKDKIRVADVNVSESVEWINGNFNFSHEKLEAIMRKMSRWYDVDIQYQGKTTNATFIGTLPRSSDIKEVLKYLELTGLVHFKTVERRVTAMP